MNHFLELAHKYNDSCEEKVTSVQTFRMAGMRSCANLLPFSAGKVY